MNGNHILTLTLTGVAFVIDIYLMSVQEQMMALAIIPSLSPVS